MIGRVLWGAIVPIAVAVAVAAIRSRVWIPIATSIVGLMHRVLWLLLLEIRTLWRTKIAIAIGVPSLRRPLHLVHPIHLRVIHVIRVGREAVVCKRRLSNVRRALRMLNRVWWHWLVLKVVKVRLQRLWRHRHRQRRMQRRRSNQRIIAIPRQVSVAHFRQRPSYRPTLRLALYMPHLPHLYLHRRRLRYAIV